MPILMATPRSPSPVLGSSLHYPNSKEERHMDAIDAWLNSLPLCWFIMPWFVMYVMLGIVMRWRK